ncbi:nucleoside diphosphate kinase regulator [Afipia sp. P52-10]|uniref:nucleoside diphosphate kinase regulator n=1 Tax=Afipia sp. P52-10 TaxID=1429916 RepID=UPI0003DF1259|nr:nucleoside diphosphate kinase regulator [Afipia sp. P52-10]ETR76558.1 nucleoside diphosphate kinase regulator [Afipia sp. P52-10]
MSNLQYGPKPKIVVSDSDHTRLVSLATAAQERLPEVAEELLTEMERADVVAADAVPANVVRMGSTVTFRADGNQERHVTLVFPADADIDKGRVSIMTPIGTALIGLSPGQSITWTARDGRAHELTVLDVATSRAPNHA